MDLEHENTFKPTSPENFSHTSKSSGNERSTCSQCGCAVNNSQLEYTVSESKKSLGEQSMMDLDYNDERLASLHQRGDHMNSKMNGHSVLMNGSINNSNNIKVRRFDDGSESNSDDKPNSSSRSRQKKFLKNFKHLPHSQEEIVLQRYSCALVGDILLQGHLYITKNYFAFHSNVFGYVTKLQIPVRSVIVVSKQKTAKIIPNAVGLLTAAEKHVFSSLLSRDSTHKFMTRVWKRALRDSGPNADLPDVSSSKVVSRVIDADYDEVLGFDESSDSEIGAQKIVVSQPQYLMERTSQSSGTIFIQARSQSETIFNNSLDTPDSPIHYYSYNLWREILQLLFSLSSSTALTILFVVILSFLFLSTLYIGCRIDVIQQQIESGFSDKNWKPDVFKSMQNLLDSNVNIRRTLENLGNLLDKGSKVKDET